MSKCIVECHGEAGEEFKTMTNDQAEVARRPDHLSRKQ